jgi:hypothetical protein
MTYEDDTFWGRVGQLVLAGFAMFGAAVIGVPVALVLALTCLN